MNYSWNCDGCRRKLLVGKRLNIFYNDAFVVAFCLFTFTVFVFLLQHGREVACAHTHTLNLPIQRYAPARRCGSERGAARMAAATGQRLQQRSARGHPSTPLLTSYWVRGRTLPLGDMMHYCRVEAKSSEWPIRSKYVDQSVATRGWSLMISVVRVGGKKNRKRLWDALAYLLTSHFLYVCVDVSKLVDIRWSRQLNVSLCSFFVHSLLLKDFIQSPIFWARLETSCAEESNNRGNVHITRNSH